MKKFLLPENGSFYKANLHCHSTFSDGRLTPAELKELYMKKGYSVIAYTDHDVFIPHAELTDGNFLALNAFEAEITERKSPNPNYNKTCHLCFIALDPDNIKIPFWHREKYLFAGALHHRDEVKFYEDEPDFEREYTPECINKMIALGKERGFFVTYNHPTWSLESYPEYMSYEGMNAMEMFNGIIFSGGFEDYNPRVYDDMLRGGKKLFCIGADDNHDWDDEKSRKFDSFRAFTMIKADKLEYKSITKALTNGNFYASTGPEINELYIEDGVVYINTSDADRIYCTCAPRHCDIAYAEDGKPLNEAYFSVSPDDGYFRITVVDKFGKVATTNAYFAEDLF